MDKDLRKLQLVELELFKKFSLLCKEYNIKYFALGGTLLGAVRHNGFIPWDDDMDIGIPREDYERFLDICNKSDIDIEVLNYKSDEKYYRFFAQLVDRSIIVRRNDKSITEDSYAWIDIFPLDGMPNNVIIRYLWKLYILYRRSMYRLSCLDVLGVDLNRKNRPIHEKIILTVGRKLHIEKILDTKKQLLKLEKALKKFPYNKSNYLVNAMGAWKFKEMFHKKYYGEGRPYKFEGIQIWGPIDHDKVCSQLYGDYMIPPKMDDRNHHNSEILETNKN